MMAARPIRLNADHVIHTFSAAHAPVLDVDTGATLVVETMDTYSRRFQHGLSLDDYLKDRGDLNPATGPIRVRGARPGDSLDVTIDRIELGPTGYVVLAPGIGVLGDTAIEPRLGRFHVRPDGLWFEDAVQLPLRPMLGVIGVAPASGAVSTCELGDHGGNLDCNDITEGATVHLPVQVEGGLLALGDAHAAMGFGELHPGVNIDATITLRVDVTPAAHAKTVWLETAQEVMTLGVAPTTDEAIRSATLHMVHLLQQKLQLSYTDAIVLTGASCDMRLGQASKFGTRISAYAAFPKSAFA